MVYYKTRLEAEKKRKIGESIYFVPGVGYYIVSKKTKYSNNQFRMGMFYGYMLGSFLMFIFMLFLLSSN